MADVRKTLFVRNLPYSATNKALEELYEDIGPIKSCFVVTAPGTEKCRGFGYVKFAMKEDAETAFKSSKSMDGRKVVMHYADRKPTKKKKKLKEKATLDSDDEEDGKETEDAENENTKIKSEPSDDTEETPKSTQKQITKSDKDSKKIKSDKSQEKSACDDDTDIKALTISKIEKSPEKDTETSLKDLAAKERHKAALTLVVKGFDCSRFEEDYKPVFSGLKNVRQVVYPVPDRGETEALVVFKSNRDTMRAIKRLHKKSIKGTELSVVLLAAEKSQAKAAQMPKRCRLIVRNLSFKCNEEKLKEAFSKFGEITEVVIPKKNDGKMLGFGFVQFSTMESANAGIQQMNTKPIIGRRVAVDWAVSKKKFEEISKKTVATPPVESSDSGSFSSEEDKIEKEDSASNTSASSGEEEEEEEGSSEESEASEEESDDDEDTPDDDEDASDDDEDASGDEGFDDSDADSDDEGTGKKVMKPARQSDVEEGKTVFIRNLAYDTEEETLQEFFEEFGGLVYSRVVVDPMTERSRGTAFVQFKKKEDAEKALAAAIDPEKPEGLVLDGRKLSLALALPRDKAQKIQQNKKEKEERDSRNLYLAREGMIRPGTQAAEGISTADLNRRSQVEKMKREKLRNPNIFISDKRLCVRNIPVSVDDAKLKKAFLKAVENKAARVTECRIMRDMQRVNAEGKGKSRGFGFIAFSEHKDALQALRTTNNNPGLFGENRRLIVEFSLENRAALQTKEKRLERAKAKQETLGKGKNTFVEPRLKKRSRDDRRKASVPEPETSDGVHVAPVKKGPKGMPSHWGAKVRDRDRGKNLKPARKPKDKRSRSQAKDVREKRRVENEGDAPKAKKRKTGRRKGEVRDDVDVLVNKYRNKFSAAFAKSKAGNNRSKWFDTS